MTCSEFLNHWNDRLDAPSRVSSRDLAEAQRHAAACDSCRLRSQAFQVMVPPWAPPAVPVGFVERVLAAHQEQARVPAILLVTQLRRIVWASGLAAAAALLLVFAVSRRPARDNGPQGIAANNPAARPWTVALAEATSATIDLARETSAPAAKVGRDVLDATRSADPTWPAPIEMPGATSEVLDSVTRRVNAGVRPISGSARRAFSFLTGPASPPAKPAVTPPHDSGA